MAMDSKTLVVVSGLGLALTAWCGCSDSGDSKTTPPGAAGSPTGAAGSSSAAAGAGGGAAAADDSAVCAKALFCDDFEAQTVDMPPSGAWTSNPNNGSVTIDTEHAFRGTHAIKATGLATSQTGSTYKSAFASLTGAPVVPVPGEKFYGRMMFYLESAPETTVHWSFIDVTGKVPGQDYTAVYRYGGQKPITNGGTFVGSQLMASYDTTDFYGTPSKGPNTDCYQQSAMVTVPVGKWSCAEWSFDGPNASMRFWLDGSEVTSLAVTGTGQGCTGMGTPQDYVWTAPTFSKLDVGWESYQADDARTIWIDDVVISTEKVGCPAAP